MRRRLSLLAGLMLVVLFGAPTEATQPREEKPPAYVLEIDQVLRGPVNPQLAERRAALVTKRDDAPTDTARRAYQRDLDELDGQIDRTRGWTLDGWAQKAERNGEPIGSSRTMRAFFIAGSARTQRELKDLKQGDRVAIDGRSVRDLFTNAGRRYATARAVRRLAPANPPRSGKRDPVPPAEPDPDGANASVKFLTPAPKERRRGQPHTLYRGAIQISAMPPEDAGPVFQLWAHVYVGLRNGDVVGPMPYYFDTVRRGEGQFNVSVSWELIELDGAPKIDPSKFTFDIIATQWGDREMR